VSNENIYVSVGDEVSIITAIRNELGFRVIINSKHWGMLYANQIFRPVGIGDTMVAYVTKVTADNRIDVSLQKQGYDQIKCSADQLLELIKRNGGSLPVGDDSAPDEITLHTQMSKKLFKRTAGYLLKRGDVELTPNKISLKPCGR
jgi:predicted RNA-binding protein (virulence factor B family)